MSRTSYLAEGDWNAMCSRCGHKFKASMLRKHWQGMWRCPTCWEPRQPQDFVRAIPDVQTPPWVQPWPADTFVDIPDVIVTESYVATDDLYGSEMLFAIATETGIPLLTE